MIPNGNQWTTGELSNDGDPVLIRHRLELAQVPDPEHDLLAILTHHFDVVQANGLPEATYNETLQTLDQAVINTLEQGGGDMVVLIETCHGKRHYYAYVKGYEAVGKRVHRLIAENPTHVLSYRAARDAERSFVRHYLQMIP